MSDTPTNRAYLALGSNIEPAINLPAAVERLADFGRVVSTSSVWESAAVGDTNQPNFLNAAVLLQTQLTPHQLKQSAIDEIEQSLMRVRDPANKNAARTIDIDIALFNRSVLSVATNQIPDPDILVRPFLASPLAELDPDYLHPTENRTLRDIADGLPTGTIHRRDDIQLMSSIPTHRTPPT